MQRFFDDMKIRVAFSGKFHDSFIIKAIKVQKDNILLTPSVDDNKIEIIGRETQNLPGWLFLVDL